ncbi:fimbrial protein [Pseudomonas protegens]|uniref:fimbrial protein n=1 Tax=Pseudomonas protegens TaxID=380021 RepID=UPI000F4B5764|nr:fimbrial protein [Pseudomonas protegens]
MSTHGCTLNAVNIKVPLGEVDMKDPSSSGVTAAEKNFSIPLSCDTETKVKLTLDAGPAGVYDNTNGLLNLANPASADTAQGVKIQILSNNAPVTFGKSLDVGVQTIEGAFDIPLQARYYRSVETLRRVWLTPLPPISSLMNSQPQSER